VLDILDKVGIFSIDGIQEDSGQVIVIMLGKRNLSMLLAEQDSNARFIVLLGMEKRILISFAE